VLSELGNLVRVRLHAIPVHRGRDPLRSRKIDFPGCAAAATNINNFQDAFDALRCRGSDWVENELRASVLAESRYFRHTTARGVNNELSYVLLEHSLRLSLVLGQALLHRKLGLVLLTVHRAGSALDKLN